MIHDNIVNIRDISQMGDIAKARNKFIALDKKIKGNDDESFEFRYRQAEVLRDFRMNHVWKEFEKFCEGSGYSIEHLTRMSKWAEGYTWEQAKKMYQDHVPMFAQMRLLETHSERAQRLKRDIEKKTNELSDLDSKTGEDNKTIYAIVADGLNGHWKQQLVGILYDLTQKKEWKPSEMKKTFEELRRIALGILKTTKDGEK